MNPSSTRAQLPKSSLIAITPSHNEEATLHALAASMLEQTVPPDLWIIVDDRSSDGTWAVANEIVAQVPFAAAIRQTDADHTGRHFAGKVDAFNSGYRPHADDGFGFVACVDADVVLPPHYFERVLKEFEARPKLGVSGGVYIDPLGRVGRHGGGSVPGPAQVFRHETFRQIDGFRPLPRGGEDALACTYARKYGWVTEALEDLQFNHLRSQGTGGGRSRLQAAFDHGRQDWDVGMDPVFEVIRMVPRVLQRPYGIAVLARLAGYVYGAVRRTRMIDPDIMAFSRAEQRNRLFSPILRRVRRFR